VESLSLFRRYLDILNVDAVIWFGEDNWEEVVAKVGEFGLKPRSVDPVGFARRNRLLLLTDEDSVHVDLSFGALPFEEYTVVHAQQIEVAPGLFASIATVESLLVMKAVAWRPKDLQDIREIVAVNPDFDQKFVISTFSEYAELLEVPERVELLEQIFDGKF
jgi:hypothetical protein